MVPPEFKSFPSRIKLSKLYPSQLYINQDKLKTILRQIKEKGPDSLDPVPVHWLRGKLILTDGHTRCIALSLLGYHDVQVEYDTDDLDWEMYEACVQWCENEGFQSVLDLKNRVIANQDYQHLWLERCQIMQQQIIDLRLQTTTKRNHDKH